MQPSITTVDSESIQHSPRVPGESVAFPLQPQATTDLLIGSINLSFLDTQYKWNNTVWRLLYLAYLTIIFFIFIYL